jgi:mannosyl-oligosaccharide alpha-1,2-mannosidase
MLFEWLISFLQLQQWLLLGGLEDKYKTLYIEAMDAVRTYMLFRPMVPGNENILFSAKVFSYGHPEQEDNLDYVYEVTHLTCFIGGMMAMGSKIFGIEQDLDIAKRLTDGCIWAYDSTPSGIMPEYSHAIPCESPMSCTWDEARWWKALDPHWASRDKEIQEYDENKKRLAKMKEEERLEAEKLEQQKLKDRDAAQLKTDAEASKGVDGNEADVPKATTLGGKEVDVKIPARKASSGNSTVARNSSASPAVAKRDTVEATYEEKLKATEQELNLTVEIDATTPRLPKLTENAASSQQPIDLLRDPARPLSHKEYVKDRLERERIPKGFSDVHFDKYILR